MQNSSSEPVGGSSKRPSRNWSAASRCWKSGAMQVSTAAGRESNPLDSHEQCVRPCRGQLERCFRAAPGTTEAIGPARLGQIEPAGLLIDEAPLKLFECAREVRSGHSQDTAHWGLWSQPDRHVFGIPTSFHLCHDALRFHHSPPYGGVCKIGGGSPSS